MWFLTLPMAIILLLPFLIGKELRISTSTWRRRGVSVAAGVSMAFVFIHVLPELNEQQLRLSRISGAPVFFAIDLRVYIAALLGFLLFYGLDNMVAVSHKHHREGEATTTLEQWVYAIHIGGFAIDCGLVSYLLIEWNRGIQAELLYCITLALHFVIVDHAFRQEYGLEYARSGRWIFIAAILVGWAVGILVPLPKLIIAYLVGFLSGGIVINSIKDELPRSGEGSFRAFTLGTVIYALLLLI